MRIKFNNYDSKSYKTNNDLLLPPLPLRLLRILVFGRENIGSLNLKEKIVIKYKRSKMKIILYILYLCLF